MTELFPLAKLGLETEDVQSWIESSYTMDLLLELSISFYIRIPWERRKVLKSWLYSLPCAMLRSERLGGCASRKRLEQWRVLMVPFFFFFGIVSVDGPFLLNAVAKRENLQLNGSLLYCILLRPDSIRGSSDLVH